MIDRINENFPDFERIERKHGARTDALTLKLSEKEEKQRQTDEKMRRSAV